MKSHEFLRDFKLHHEICRIKPHEDSKFFQEKVPRLHETSVQEHRGAPMRSLVCAIIVNALDDVTFGGANNLLLPFLACSILSTTFKRTVSVADARG